MKMNKIKWILIAIVVGSYIVSCIIENNAKRVEKNTKRKMENAEWRRIEQVTEAAVMQMVSRTNAVDDWKQQLSKGDNYRFEPILTIELEKLWLQKQPILFIGYIKDISTYKQSKYLVLVEKRPFSLFGTELTLSLIASKNRIDSFLKENPDLFKDLGFSNVGVVARIHSIRTIDAPGGEHEKMKVGDGELIDIIYMGDLDF